MPRSCRSPLHRVSGSAELTRERRAPTPGVRIAASEQLRVFRSSASASRGAGCPPFPFRARCRRAECGSRELMDEAGCKMQGLPARPPQRRACPGLGRWLLEYWVFSL